MIIIITLFIFGSIIIVTLIGLTLARAIGKEKIIKQTQLIYEQRHLKILKDKEVLENINCEI